MAERRANGWGVGGETIRADTGAILRLSLLRGIPGSSSTRSGQLHHTWPTSDTYAGRAHRADAGWVCSKSATGETRAMEVEAV